MTNIPEVVEILRGIAAQLEEVPPMIEPLPPQNFYGGPIEAGKATVDKINELVAIVNQLEVAHRGELVE